MKRVVWIFLHRIAISRVGTKARLWMVGALTKYFSFLFFSRAVLHLASQSWETDCISAEQEGWLWEHQRIQVIIWCQLLLFNLNPLPASFWPKYCKIIHIYYLQPLISSLRTFKKIEMPREKKLLLHLKIPSTSKYCDLSRVVILVLFLNGR